jgi:hypothetical protein
MANAGGVPSTTAKTSQNQAFMLSRDPRWGSMLPIVTLQMFAFCVKLPALVSHPVTVTDESPRDSIQLFPGES